MADFQKWLLIAAVALYVWLSVVPAEAGIPPRTSPGPPMALPDPVDPVDHMSSARVVVGNAMPIFFLTENYVVRVYWDRDHLDRAMELIPISWDIPPDPPQMLRAGHRTSDLSDGARAAARRDEPLHEHEFGLVFVRFV